MTSHGKGWARHPHRDVPLSQRGPKGLCSTVRTRVVGCRCREFAPWSFPVYPLADRSQAQWYGCRADNSLQWAMELNRDFHNNGYFCCKEDNFGYLEVKHRLQNKIEFTQGLKIAILENLWGLWSIYEYIYDFRYFYVLLDPTAQQHCLTHPSLSPQRSETLLRSWSDCSPGIRKRPCAER